METSISTSIRSLLWTSVFGKLGTLLLLLWSVAGVLSHSGREDAILQHCHHCTEFMGPIWDDLQPWAADGISADLADATLKETMAYGVNNGLGFLYANRTLFVLADPEAAARSGSPDVLVYVAVLQGVVRAFGEALPDLEFVIQFRDSPRVVLERPEGPPLPILNYCKCSESADIAIPFPSFYYDRDGPASLMDPSNDYRPWAQRREEAYAFFTNYSGRFSQTPTTARFDEAGLPLAQGRPGDGPRNKLRDWARLVQAEWDAAANASAASAAEAAEGAAGAADGAGAAAGAADGAGAAAGAPVGLRLSIGEQARSMRDWGSSKYLVHVDGIACSHKLERALATGSLVMREESGLVTFFTRLMRPMVHHVPFWRFRPQELLAGLAWAQQNPGEAERVAAAGQALARRLLGFEGLRCFWALLWAEYAALQRFQPGGPERKYPFKVPAEEFLARIAARASPANEDVELRESADRTMRFVRDFFDERVDKQ